MIEQTILTIPGRPATGSFKFRKTGHRYTPQNVAEWKAYVKMMVIEAVNEMIPKHHPVELTILVRRPRPASPKNPTAKVPCPWAWTTKPDCDNITKPLKDAIKTIGFADDAQVTDLIVRKRWGEREEIEIRFRELTEEELSLPL